MDNQQQSNKILWTGNTIKEKDYFLLIEDYQKGDSMSYLTTKYNYSLGAIRNFLKNNNITIRNVKESVKKFHKNNEIIIDPFLEENIIGWILGDGGLRIPKNGINPKFTYADLKEDHILYIQSILSKYNIKSSIHQNKASLCFQLFSEARPEFHKYYDLFYGYEGLNENNQKRKILPNVVITPIILRNWYIGDGSSSNQGGTTIYNKGFIGCKYKNEFIIEQINKICKVSVYKLDNGCFQYYFNHDSLKKLLDYIGECPVESYKYKWNLLNVQRL